MSLVTECADIVQEAVRSRTAISRLTDRFPELTLDVGYEVQAEIAARRIAAGERVIGAKLGLTSRAAQEQMNVAEPLYGRLFSGGVHQAGAPVVVSSLIRPRVEPEIVLIIGEDLRGPGITAADVLAATRAVACGLEIVDSRYEHSSFAAAAAADVVADNASEARMVLGPSLVSPDGLDPALIGLLLEVDGEQVATAAGAASMGHPAEATAMLANFLGARGHAIEPGWIIFTGGLTEAQPLHPGSHITANFGHLGSVTVRGI